MKRWITIVTLMSAWGLMGCHRDEPPQVPPNDDPQPPIASPIDDGDADSASDDGQSTDGNGVNHSPPTNDGTTPPATDDMRWLRQMASQDPRELTAAVDHFDTSFDDGGLQVFHAHLNDDDVEVRRGAVYGLYTRFDPNNQKLLTAVKSALDDEDPIVRRVALRALNLPAFPREAFLESIPRIAKHINQEHEPDPQTRAQVARMVARYTTSGQPALPALNEAVRSDPDYNVRSACLNSIYNIARNAEEALPAPTHVLIHDRDSRLRRVAAKRLGKYGAGAAPSVPQLIIALGDQGVPARQQDDPLFGQDEPVCIAAADALALIGKPAVGPLMNALKSENRSVLLLSIRALGDMGAAAGDATSTLQALTRSTDSGVAIAAKAALVRIGSE